jgi:hypothetical protein
MADIFDSELDSGFHAGDINVDNDKNFADRGSVIATDNNGDVISATGPGSQAAGGDAAQAVNSNVLQGSHVDNFVADSDGAVTNSGSGGVQGVNTGVLNNSSLAGGDQDHVVSGHDNAQQNADHGGHATGAFGDGSNAQSFDNVHAFGSALGNNGPVQQIQGNEVGDHGVLAGRDAAVDNSTHNQTSIHGDHNQATTDHSLGFADQSEHTDVTAFEDSFNEDNRETHISDDDTVVSHSNVDSEVLDHNNFLDDFHA